MYETIRYMNVDGVATITLNRPDKLNAFNRTDEPRNYRCGERSWKRQSCTMSRLYRRRKRLLFRPGLSEVDENMDHGQVLREQYGPMIKQIMRLEKPIVAAVNGVAAGAGFSLALACDFRLVSEKASFLNAFINIGLIPDSGNLYFLQNLIGYSKAAELSILGEKVPAEKAVEMGLANEGDSNRNMG